MKAYVSFLKMIGLLLLIPVGIGIIGLLAFIGFGMDFSNAWSNKGSANSEITGYMFLLPLGFITGAGWLLYKLSVRRSYSREQTQKARIRRQILHEQQLGSTVEENIVNLLKQNGPLPVEDLVRLCNIDQEEVTMVLHKLLQKEAVRQRIQQGEAIFYLEPKQSA